MNVIACISPRYVADKPEEKHSWEPTKLEQLLSFNNRMGHNANWQLGYGKVVAGTHSVHLETRE